MDHVEVDGLEIAYERAGQGSPIVLLHGYLGDGPSTWRRQLEELSDAFTVVAWDAPGSGGSSDPPASFRMPDFADCLAGFVRALELEGPHVVGLSFGGALALELYRRHPEIPRTLVLAAAYAGWAGSLPQDVVEERLQQALRLAELPPAQLVRELGPTLFSDAASAEAVAEFSAAVARFHPHGLRAMARSVAAADLRDVLARIVVPTLLIYGEKDLRAPHEVAASLHAAIPGSRLVVLSGVGHASSVEAPERFNAEVRAFLESAGLTAELPSSP